MQNGPSRYLNNNIKLLLIFDVRVKARLHVTPIYRYTEALMQEIQEAIEGASDTTDNFARSRGIWMRTNSECIVISMWKDAEEERRAIPLKISFQFTVSSIYIICSLHLNNNLSQASTYKTGSSFLSVPLRRLGRAAPRRAGSLSLAVDGSNPLYECIKILLLMNKHQRAASQLRTEM